MKAACPQPCPWGQPPECRKEGTHNVPPKLLRAKHRVKWLSRRTASFREAHLPGSGWSHHPLPACWSWGLIPALPAWLWLVPTPVQVASGCCTQWWT